MQVESSSVPSWLDVGGGGGGTLPRFENDHLRSRISELYKTMVATSQFTLTLAPGQRLELTEVPQGDMGQIFAPGGSSVHEIAHCLERYLPEGFCQQITTDVLCITRLNESSAVGMHSPFSELIITLKEKSSDPLGDNLSILLAELFATSASAEVTFFVKGCKGRVIFDPQGITGTADASGKKDHVVIVSDTDIPKKIELEIGRRIPSHYSLHPARWRRY